MTHAHYPALNGARLATPAAERGAFLAVAGNLGVGKTTLVELVTRATGFEPHFELAEENPYLARFYADMRAWGFHSQLFFLVKRSEQHRRLASNVATAVQDRAIYEDAEIWARNLYERGQIADEDYRLYSDLYEELCRVFLRLIWFSIWRLRRKRSNGVLPFVAAHSRRELKRAM